MRTCPKCQRTYADDMDYCPRDAAALVSVVSATQAELESSLAQRFRIVRRLGGGGMGSVFLAEQIGVGNRPVALKVLLRKLLDDPEFLLRFRNEAASTGRIDHPNVVTIYESGQADDGTPYIAMQYLEGESLRARLKSRGALPVEECATIVAQAARGLNAAHKLGIIHRDLKPDNIFLTKGAEGELLVKVVDFGIAKLRESATHTLTGTVLGTPPYMSFEQASGMKSEELDARSDIYSFGVVAYEMLTGRVPFHSDTPVGYIRKHLMENPPPFQVVKPELAAPQLEQVVMKALAKDRDARCGSVLEFSRAFAQAADAPRGVGTPKSTAKISQPSDEHSRRRGAFATQASTGAFEVGAPGQGASTVPLGTVKENSKDGLKYLWIPPGIFQMGCSPGDSECSDDEQPAHLVTISKGYWMSRTPVTVGAYKRFAKARLRRTAAAPDFNKSWANEDMPMVEVTWYDAEAYCRWAGGRLPREAEWEYAARAGSTGARYAEIDSIAWHSANSGDRTHIVGEKRANEFGLYDTLGNVWEWVNDWYGQNYYRDGLAVDPPGPANGRTRVLRGGSWSDNPRSIRASNRDRGLPDSGSSIVGFRCVWEIAVS